MPCVVVSLLHSLRFFVKSRASLHLEIIALRHQLAVLHRSRRPRLRLCNHFRPSRHALSASNYRKVMRGRWLEWDVVSETPAFAVAA
jgi:hypothetical protein